MANIRVDLDFPIVNGSEAIFIAPCDCSDIAGLIVYYPSAIGVEASIKSKEFIFKDAHGSDLSDMDHLFKTGAYVKVLLNVTEGIAYIQNADTNSYIEGKFSGIVIAVNTSKWVKQDDGTYINTVAAEQIVEGDLLDASLYGEYTEEQAEAFDFLIESIEAQNGKVVFTASEKIKVALSILLRGRVNMEEKNVFVHDLKAASIEYDNTKSGLKATNLQDAIDELVTSINGLVVVVTADGWNTQDDGTFRKIIPVEQITGNETFDISLYPGDIHTEEQVVAFSEHVTSIETSEGAIILTATEEINVQFRIFLCGKINFDNNMVLMKEYSAVDIAFDDTVAKLGAKNIQEADVALALRPVNNNILINSNFANPVNQRGLTEYDSTGNSSGHFYTVDRWAIVNKCLLMVNPKYVTLSSLNLSNNRPQFNQWLEFPTKYIGKYVISAKYRVSKGIDNKALALALIGKDVNLSYHNFGSEYLVCDGAWHTISVLCEIPILTSELSDLYVSIGSQATSGCNVISSDISIDVEWVKLEEGEVATPYVPRLYDEEFLMCQRYYQDLTGRIYPIGLVYTNAIKFYANLPVRMRAKPTVVISDEAHDRFVQKTANNNGNTTVTGGIASMYTVSAVKVTLLWTKNNHGFTSGGLICAPNKTGDVTLDAEL